MPTNLLVEHFGVGLVDSARRHGVELSGLGEPIPAHGAWTGGHLVRLMRYLGQVMEDAFFRLASSPCPSNSSSFGVELMVLSDTLGDALDRYFRYYGVFTSGLSFHLDVNGPVASCYIDAADPSLDPRHILPDWYTIRLTGLARWLVGEEVPLDRVDFAHSAAVPESAYAPLFGRHVHFNQPRNGFHFASALLGRRVARTLEDLSVLDAKEYDPEHSTLRKTWSNRLRLSLRHRLYRMAPVPTMEELAQEYGVSGQTLRRGLKAEGTSYRQVKADARREVVLGSISDNSLTLSQISVLAGFAEPNGLVRAIKAWTGLSPSEFRKAAGEYREKLPS